MQMPWSPIFCFRPCFPHKCERLGIREKIMLCKRSSRALISSMNCWDVNIYSLHSNSLHTRRKPGERNYQLKSRKIGKGARSKHCWSLILSAVTTSFQGSLINRAEYWIHLWKYIIWILILCGNKYAFKEPYPYFMFTNFTIEADYWWFSWSCDIFDNHL